MDGKCYSVKCSPCAGKILGVDLGIYGRRVMSGVNRVVTWKGKVLDESQFVGIVRFWY